MPELDQYARVTDAGDVPVQGVGNVQVANMSPAEAATAIHDRYVSAHFLNHPQVSVVVDQYATQEVTLIGEVQTPGAYPIATPRPILDVIALGGGLNDLADREHPCGTAWGSDNPIRYNVSNDARAGNQGSGLGEPWRYSRSRRRLGSSMFLAMSIARADITMTSNNESQMSLLEALSIAGGAAKTAKLGHARLLRKADHTETQISLGDIQKGKQRTSQWRPEISSTFPLVTARILSSRVLRELPGPPVPLPSIPGIEVERTLRIRLSRSAWSSSSRRLMYMTCPAANSASRCLFLAMSRGSQLLPRRDPSIFPSPGLSRETAGQIRAHLLYASFDKRRAAPVVPEQSFVNQFRIFGLARPLTRSRPCVVPAPEQATYYLVPSWFAHIESSELRLRYLVERNHER